MNFSFRRNVAMKIEGHPFFSGDTDHPWLLLRSWQLPRSLSKYALPLVMQLLLRMPVDSLSPGHRPIPEARWETFWSTLRSTPPSSTMIIAPESDGSYRGGVPSAKLGKTAAEYGLNSAPRKR